MNMATEQNSGLIDLDALMREAAAAECPSAVPVVSPVVSARERTDQRSSGRHVAMRALLAVAMVAGATGLLPAGSTFVTTGPKSKAIASAPRLEEPRPEASRAPAPLVAPSVTVAPPRAHAEAASKGGSEPALTRTRGLSGRKHKPTAGTPPPQAEPSLAPPGDPLANAAAVPAQAAQEAPEIAPEPSPAAAPTTSTAVPTVDLQDAIRDAVDRVQDAPAASSSAGLPPDGELARP